MIWRWHIKFNYVLISRGKCFSTLLFYVFMLKVPLLSKWTFHFEPRSSGSRVNFQCWRAGWFLLENNQKEVMDARVDPAWVLFAESLPSFSLACSTDCSPDLLQGRLLSSSHGTGFIAVSIWELSCYMQKPGFQKSVSFKTESLMSSGKRYWEINIKFDVTQEPFISWFLSNRDYEITEFLKIGFIFLEWF